MPGFYLNLDIIYVWWLASQNKEMSYLCIACFSLMSQYNLTPSKVSSFQ